MRKLALVLTVCACAGCGGGGGGSGTGGAGGGPSGGVAEQERELALENAYDNGVDTCSQYSVKDLAGTFGTKPNKEAIAKAVGEGESDAELRESARKGCLDALNGTVKP